MVESTKMDALLDNATAVITGSTRGIGAEIAKRFASAGATVVVSGRDASDGKKVVNKITEQEGEAAFVQADVQKPIEIKQLIETTDEKHGGIDVLVNNAAFETDTSPEEVDIEAWNSIVDIDFRAYWLTAKYAYPYLAESDQGAIVNVGSNHSSATQPKKFPYNAIKSGIDGMTRAMATAWGVDGIRVNSINPGWTGVERVKGELTKEDLERLGQIHPLGRIASPDEVADCALFLASEMASFVTGECLVVDGGRSAVLQDDLYVNDLNMNVG